MEETEKMLCKGCAMAKFGKNCYYYWDLKKECTMHTPDSEPVPK